MSNFFASYTSSVRWLHLSENDAFLLKTVAVNSLRGICLDTMIPRALLILPLIVIGCQSPVDLSPGPTRAAPVIESNILRSANMLRGNRPSLIRVSSLDRAAQQQAQAMARTRQVSHSAAGGTLRSRTRARGRIGENIARVPDPSARGSVFVDLWERSRGHRRNLLDRKFRKTGIGVVRRGGQTYAAQVFAE